MTNIHRCAFQMVSLGTFMIFDENVLFTNVFASILALKQLKCAEQFHDPGGDDGSESKHFSLFHVVLVRFKDN